MAMKRLSILMLIITFLVLITQPSQAADYLSLKDEYIKNHPDQVIIPYPWEPTTSIKVLPFNYEIPAAPANNFSITACRNQFESASFIITAQKNISGIGINVADLYNAQGNRIQANAINVRLVKVWYQAGEGDIWYDTPGSFLTPELLLKDDSLVKVDYVNRTNYLKVTINGNQQYIDISNPSAKFPVSAKVYDAESLQPFSLKANENKQIWLTIHIPTTTSDGDYFGNITITTPTESPTIINIKVTVLPFDLEATPIEYSLYYRGILSTSQNTEISSEWKTTEQYSSELQNLKEHGVLYPTFYQDDDSMLDTALQLRNKAGLPKDHIYLGEFNAQIGNATNTAGLLTVAKTVVNWRNHTSSYGYGDVYFYGIDEARGDVLLSQRPAWQTVHNNNGKLYVASYTEHELIDGMGDVLDLGVTGKEIDPLQAERWHNYGHKIFLYNQPQVGVEDPYIYRRNYGFALWNAGYDGAMNFAYQCVFGQSIWNDFDDKRFRDHVFAYPTSNGVIDTIQWEGWREGVDDTRYLATLIKKEGSNTSAKAIVSGSLSQGNDMPTIRKNVINQILKSPTAQFTANTTQGKAPLTVQFTDQSVSAGTTSYTWNINNDGVVDYTSRALHIRIVLQESIRST